MRPVPPDPWLRWRQVRDLTGLGRTTAWRMRRDGDFPDPVPISRGRVAWRESDIVAWNATRGVVDHLRAPPRLAETRAVTRRAPESRVATEPPAQDPSPPAPSASAGELSRPVRRAMAAIAEGQLRFDF